MGKRLRITFTLILILFAIGSRAMIAMSKPASKLGAVDGRLAECPNKPNCVSSQATDESHSIAALEIPANEAPEDAWKRLRALIECTPRARIVTESEGYMHCEFRTSIMRYVDDVEFLLDVNGSKIDFRSASRLGYSDMGANRKRMESLRTSFTQ